MWISEIKLTNFRPYKEDEGPVTFTFDKSSKENFTIIQAPSDVGKTTLLSAIAWCLYGREFHTPADKTIGSFCRQKIYDMKEGDTANLEVEVTLNDNQKNQPLYTIRRGAIYQKIDNKPQILKEDLLAIDKWEGDDMRPVSDSMLQMTINSILPEDIHLFFLFEGEKLEKHFSFNDNDNIRNAIEKTSQIKQVKTSIEHLRNVSTDVWTSDETKVDKDMLALQHEITELDEYVHDNKQRIDQFNKEINEAKAQKREIDSFLEKHNVELVRQRAARQQELEQANSDLEEQNKTIQEEMRETVLTLAPLSILSKPLMSLYKKLDEEKKKDKLEPNIENKYIKELLKQKMCVCGRPLGSDSNEEREAVELLKTKSKDNEISELRELLREGRYVIYSFLENVKSDFVENVDVYVRRLERNNEKIESNAAKIEEIEDEQKNIDVPQVSAKTEEKRSLQDGIEKQLKTVARLEAAVKQKDANLSQKRQSFEQLGKKKTGSEKKKKQAEFINRAISHLESIEKEILEEVRKKVQEKTWKYFSTLHWEKNKYSSFEINGQYDMHLYDKNNTNWMHDLASGPKQLLLLSFIAALKEVSGFKFPVFFDTPFANIDNQQRENVAKKLPDYLKGTQVIMLMKDQEYTPKIRQLLSKRISKEFQLQGVGGVAVLE